ncbi:HCL521Cp [Eremothecium sinecaudum]|uniref:HCL521Cp n=1 Tax=Eremothecium sinecaudum TaxID=45286 RepID=A0A109UW33_9SACH|nr:HCL521Cp [Eremothecium sinecaudum]AMD19630.1 HCL521Cp [Eremothecium sinecaudum]
MSSTSTAPTHTSTPTCPGGKCHMPTDTGGTAILIGVLVPLAIIALGLGIVVYKVWKRNKREALEDYDPNFVGDAEFVPVFVGGGHYPASVPAAYPSNHDFHDWKEEASMERYTNKRE